MIIEHLLYAKQELVWEGVRVKKSLVPVPWEVTDEEAEGRGGRACDPTASVWRSWGLNPSLNLKAVTLPIPSPWSSEVQRREEMKQGARGEAVGEPERIRRPAERGGEQSTTLLTAQVTGTTERVTHELVCGANGSEAV